MKYQKIHTGKINKSVSQKRNHISHLKNLNLLLAHYDSAEKGVMIPTKVVASSLAQELNSKTVIEFCKTIPPLDTENLKVNDFAAMQKEIPEKLYFFLWSLRNTDAVPVCGVLNSIELRTALYGLIRTTQVMEHFAKKYPGNADIQEMCGFYYLDLAGLAFHSRKGILLNGITQNYHRLVRKAIRHFQSGIKLCRELGEKIDGQHYSIFDSIHEKYTTDEKRINMYLNPWHFFYIASSLNSLNDKKIACLYLNRARTIIDNIEINQNPRVVSQKNLLSALFTILDMADQKLTLPRTNVIHLKRNLNRINKNREIYNEKFYSPIIENELLKQLALQEKQASEGILPEEIRKYLRSIYSLYNEVSSSFQRNKIIYRLNLSPVKLKSDAATKIRKKQPKKNREGGRLKLIRGETFAKAS